MASKFKAGMLNFIEVLNQMWDAYAAGPYNALPLSGGTMTGALINTVGVFATSMDSNNFRNISSALLNVDAGATDPTVGQYVEAARIGVRGVPTAGYYGSWRFFTSAGTGSLGYAGHKLGIFASDNQGGPGMAISPTPTITLYGTGRVDVAGAIQSAGIGPDTDNTRAVGSAAVAYATIYARTGTINTSDARFKCDWADLSAAEIAAACELARVIRSYRWIDAVATKGDDARRHIGPTVQAAIEIMTAHGLDPFDYGFICHDEWAERVIEHPAIEPLAAVAPADGMPGSPAVEGQAAYTETIPAGDRYAFRYAELSMFIAAGQAAQQDALERRIAALEAT